VAIASLELKPSGNGIGTFLIGPLEVRPEEMQVLAGDRRVNLTVREFQVFYVLVQAADRVVPRPEIYHQVWGRPLTRRDRSVDVFVRKVRGKLEAAAPDWRFVHTHFGIGYRFAPEPLSR
jgi:DNA-binding response OmpR family regulator